MKIVITIVIILVVGATLFVLIRSQGNERAAQPNNVSGLQLADISYTDITPAELATHLSNDTDVYLLDVHTPEQTHIAGTDAFIPYNEIANYRSDLPDDLDTPIIVYCRSGSMSRIASEYLIDMGYTNVSNLEGGIQAWNQHQAN